MGTGRSITGRRSLTPALKYRGGGATSTAGASQDGGFSPSSAFLLSSAAVTGVRTKRPRPDLLLPLVFIYRGRSGRDSLAFVNAFHPWRFVRARRRFGANLSKVSFFTELLLVCLRRLGDHVHHLGFIVLLHSGRYFFLGGGGGRCGTVNPFPGILGSGRGCGDGGVGRGGCESGMG